MALARDPDDSHPPGFLEPPAPCPCRCSCQAEQRAHVLMGPVGAHTMWLLEAGQRQV